MASSRIIVIGSDHAGFDMKEFVKSYLQKRGVPFEDAGATTLDPADDYPDFASIVASRILKGEFMRGILICGTGVGISIAANRFRGIRAALCMSPDMARMSRAHNNSNVLVLGGRTTPFENVPDIIEAWLHTEFEGGRHERRVELLDKVRER